MEVAFSSRPLGLGVSIDGIFRGNTPLRIALDPGAHTLAFEGGERVLAEIRVTEGGRKLWTFYEAEGAIR